MQDEPLAPRPASPAGGYRPPYVPSSTLQAGPGLVAKRVLDVATAAVVLGVTLPVSAVVAAAIKLTSRGPVLFRATRVGKNGRIFTMYKFRSMVHGADPEVHRQFVVDSIRGAADDRQVFKVVDDSRVTRVGRFIRRASIDELPQLVNVLRGEMSLVGPRPDELYAVEAYEPWQLRRFSVMGGLTGMWQTSGRSKLSPSDMLRLDIDYVDAWSFWLDLKLLVKTVPDLLRPSRAR